MLMAWITAFSFAYLDFTSPTGRTMTVRLVQGNIAQEMKFDPVRMAGTMRYFVSQVSGSKAISKKLYNRNAQYKRALMLKR